MKMHYQVIIINTENKITVKDYETPNVPLSDLQGFVGGHIEFVPCDVLKPLNPFLLMCLDDEGKLKEKPINGLASVLYGNPFDCIAGDVVILTRFNPDPLAEPDAYAIDFPMAEKIRSFLERLMDV